MFLPIVISLKIMFDFPIHERDMVESMTATAERIADYEMIYGKEEVERFLDAVLAIQEHVDPSIIRRKQFQTTIRMKYEEEVIRKTPYDDLWDLDIKAEQKISTNSKKQEIPSETRKKTFYCLFRNIAVNLKSGNVIS